MKAELYIGTGDADENTELFNHLESHKEEIESAFGKSLNWEKIEDKRACRINIWSEGDVLNDEKHSEYMAWMVEQLSRLQKAFPVVRLKGRE